MNKQKIRMISVVMTFAMLLTQVCVQGMSVALAGGGAGSVVINEVAWAGSADNSNDEWIELYNTTAQDIDLAGWMVEDDYTSQYVIESGTIPAHGYFLIEDDEDVVSNVTADALIGLSLANTGDTLILKDAAGLAIDSIGTGGGMWYGGDGTSKATMERIDPSVLVDSADNFGSAVSGNGSVASLGSAILGTPGGQNSIYQGSPEGLQIMIDLSDEGPLPGQTITATVSAVNADDLFAYGFDVIYDPAVLTYVSSAEGGFLSENGQVSTAFNTALENGISGKLVAGNARLVSPADGVSGNGDLVVLQFEVVGGEGSEGSLVFGGGSFAADSVGDVLAGFSGADFTVGSGTSDPVTGLGIELGADLYSLELNWTPGAGGADSYIVSRVNVLGVSEQIGSGAEAVFVDSLDIVPGIAYEYEVRAVKNGIQSAGVSVIGVETRGLAGDNDRSGRVDGRDVENLARHYATSFGDEGYAALVDTTYDGLIDGSDLIDIGANFGLTYP